VRFIAFLPSCLFFLPSLFCLIQTENHFVLDVSFPFSRPPIADPKETYSDPSLRHTLTTSKATKASRLRSANVIEPSSFPTPFSTPALLPPPICESKGDSTGIDSSIQASAKFLVAGGRGQETHRETKAHRLSVKIEVPRAP
jgi:hypothetical protein